MPTLTRRTGSGLMLKEGDVIGGSRTVPSRITNTESDQ